MFQQLANQFAPRDEALRVHPAQLSRWLDELWARGPGNLGAPGGGPPFLGVPGIVGAIAQGAAPGAGAFVGPSGVDPADARIFNANAGLVPPNAPIWDHLIYAYLLENTGLVEIFGEVVRLGVAGEQLTGQFSVDAAQWLRTTEELFFRDAPSFTIGSVTSSMRPESRIVRRNAYWRMFGFDLSHPIPPRVLGGDGSQPWKRDTGAGVNTTFREKWTELLRQIWLGQENQNNQVGPNSTDDEYLLLLCDALRDMMNMRRRAGMLAREEFWSVALMSWFDLTLSADTPIVVSLRAQATSPADRLAQIAQRVGVTSAPRSRELFELAPNVSLVLRLIEAGFFANQGAVQLFYVPASVVLRPIMTNIIDLWQSATGDSLKGRAGLTRPDTLAQPLRAPGSQPLAGLASSSNGVAR